MRRLKTFELLMILIAINLLTIYSFVIGHVQETAHPLPGEEGFWQAPPVWGIWLWLTVFITSVIIFLTYSKKVIGGLARREIDLLYMIGKNKEGWKIKVDKDTRRKLGFIDKSQLLRMINNKLVPQKYAIKRGNKLKLTELGRSILKMRS